MLFDSRGVRSSVLAHLQFAAVLALLPLAAGAQVTVTISPSEGTFTDASLSVGVTWCSDMNPLNASSRVIKLNGVTVTSQFGYAPKPAVGCTYKAFSGGTVTLRSGSNTLTASISDNAGTVGQASATYVLSDKLAATLALAYPDQFRDVGRCVADCFAATAQYSTPTYRSLDVERGVTLLHRSDRVQPQGIVQIDATDNSPTPVNTYSLLLKRTDGTFVTFVNGSQELYFVGGSGVTRLVGQFDASTFPDTALNYTAVVRSRWTDGTIVESTTPARVMIANGASSVFGAGWDLAQLQHLKVQSDGVLAISGNGSASFFTGSYTSPPGDFSTLVRNGDGTYDRTYPDGTKYRFSAAGILTAITDRFGNVTGIGRDGASRVTSITDPAGYAIGFAYDASGRLDSITTPSAGGSLRTSNFTVDANGDLTAAYDPDNVAYLTATYFAGHRIATMGGRVGSTWSWSYAADGTLSSMSAPTVTANGTPTNPTTSLVSPARELLTRIAQGTQGSAASPVTRGLDLRAQATNPRGYTTFFTLNRWGSPTQIDFPTGPAATATYDATTGVVTRTVDQNGHSVYFTWTGSQVTTISDVTAGRTVYIEYEPTYNRPTHIYGNTVEQWFYYTGPHIDSSKAGVQPKVQYAHDAYGRITQVKDAALHTTTSYPSTVGLKNTDSTVAPGKRRTSMRYDAYGRTTAVITPDAQWDSSAYDVLNRVILSTDAAGNTATYAYTGLYLTSITDARGQVYSFTPNALGWVEQETRPGSTAITAGYDANGNVISQTNRRGQTVTFAYDALDRMTSRTADGQTTTFGYGFVAGVVDGYVATANALSADTLYRNAAGRLTRAATGRGGNWYRLAYAYDANGQLSSIGATSNMWGGTKTQSFTYNADGALQYFDTWAGRTTLNPGASNEDLPTSVTYPSGLTLSRTFSSLHTAYDLSFNVADVTNRLGAQLTLDGNGRIYERARPPGDSTVIFQYGNARRLLSRTKYAAGSRICAQDADTGYKCTLVDGHFVSQDQFTYDAVGNWMDGVTALDIPGNRVRAANGYTFNYDADGNLVSKQGAGFTQTLEWNSLGQLTRATTNGTVVDFGYDGFGRRVSKTVAGVATGYVHNGDNLYLELDGSGAVVTEYAYWGLDNPQAMQKGGQTYYFVPDPVSGSVKGLVRGVDNTVQAQYGYTAFGADEPGSVDNVGNRLRYAGREYNSETQLYYNRARYYDPVLGRFISEDPIGVAGGINLYAYAGNDPVNGRDPSGTCPGESKAVASDIIYLEGTNTTATGSCPMLPITPPLGNPVAPPGFNPLNPDGRNPRPSGGGGGSGSNGPCTGMSASECRQIFTAIQHLLRATPFCRSLGRSIYSSYYLSGRIGAGSGPGVLARYVSGIFGDRIEVTESGLSYAPAKLGGLLAHEVLHAKWDLSGIKLLRHNRNPLPDDVYYKMGAVCSR